MRQEERAMQVSQVKPLADAFRENIETVIVG